VRVNTDHSLSFALLLLLQLLAVALMAANARSRASIQFVVTPSSLLAASSGRRRFDLVSELRHSLPTVARPSQQVHYASPLVYRHCLESRIIDTVNLLISENRLH